MKHALFTFFLFIFLFPSCKKYPDGPDISLRSRRGRLCAYWGLDTYLQNGSDSTSAFFSLMGYDYELAIGSNYVYNTYGNAPDEGNWKFGDKDENLYFQSFNTGAQQQKYTILKLEKKKLWLKHVKTNGVVEEFHYIQ